MVVGKKKEKDCRLYMQAVCSVCTICITIELFKLSVNLLLRASNP